MIGQFIAEKVQSNGKYVTWNWKSCYETGTTAAFKINAPATSPMEDEALFSVYPVPNNGLFTTAISSPIDEKYTISVYNSIGALVFEKKEVQVYGMKEEVIDLQHALPGFYYVLFKNDTHHIVKKISILK